MKVHKEIKQMLEGIVSTLVVPFVVGWIIGYTAAKVRMNRRIRKIFRNLFALATIALFASAAQADVFDALAVATAASDVVTTEAALRSGFVESNMRNRNVRIGANVALTGAALLAAHELRRSGHRGSARAVQIATILTWGFIAAHNVRTMQGGIR